MNTDYKAKFDRYIDSVMTGKRICGNYERKAVERHVNDIKKNKKFYFDKKAGIKACNFFKLLKHWKGTKAGQEIILEGWEVFIVASIFGWKNVKTNYRRFSYADIVMARKNGKTSLAAGIALYMLVADNEPGAEIYSSGMDSKQASICWECATQFAKKSPLLSKVITFYKHSIFIEETASSFKPLTKDSKNKDGLNPHLAVCDERHAWTSNNLFNVIKSGMGSRKQPLILSITTAGLNLSLPYFKEYIYLKQILDGTINQDNQFAIIFELDEEDNWKDKRCWRKANPNLGVSVYKSYMDEEFKEALKKGGENEVNFKTKNLNMWVDAPTVWIQDDKVAQCNFDTKEDDLLGKECWCGFDFASHVDIVALAMYFPTVKNKPFKMVFWIPKQKIIDATDRVDYRKWQQQGLITATEGDFIDIDKIVADIVALAKIYQIRNFAFDPYKMYHGVIQGLIKEGLENVMDEFPQNIKNMSEPTKELERLICSQEIDLMHNQVLRWMFRNVVIFRDINANIKVDKAKSINKIDGVVACINALGGYMSESANEKGSPIYVNHELRVLR